MLVRNMEFCSMLWGSLDRRKVWGRIYRCICMDESLCCSPETIATLLIDYTPVQNKKLKKKMLTRMWRKGNLPVLLVGLYIGAVTVENSLEDPQKVKNRTTIWPRNSTPGYISKQQHNSNKTLTRKDTCTPTFITALFTATKVWKQPKCLSSGECIKKIWQIHTHTHTHTHSGILLSHKNFLPFAAP